MASTDKPIHSPKKDKISERCCFVCKRSILLFKYTNLQGSNSQKKEIIKQLVSVLDCDEKTSREWNYICDPCRNIANEIFMNLDKSAVLSDEVNAMKKELVRKYKSTGVLKSQSSKKIHDRRLSSSSKTSTSSSSVERRKSSPLNLDSRGTKSPDKTPKAVKLQNGKGENTKPGSLQRAKPRKSSANPLTANNPTATKNPDRAPKGNLQNGKRGTLPRVPSVKQEQKKTSLGSARSTVTTPTQQTKTTSAKTKGGSVSSRTNKSPRKAVDKKENQSSPKKKPSVDKPQQQHVLNDEDAKNEASSLNIAVKKETPMDDTKDDTTTHTEPQTSDQTPEETPKDVKNQEIIGSQPVTHAAQPDTPDHANDDSSSQFLPDDKLNPRDNEDSNGTPVKQEVPQDPNIVSDINEQVTNDQNVRTSSSNRHGDLTIAVDVGNGHDEERAIGSNPTTDDLQCIMKELSCSPVEQVPPPIPEKGPVVLDSNIVPDVSKLLISDEKFKDEDSDLQARSSIADEDFVIHNKHDVDGRSKRVIEDLEDLNTNNTYHLHMQHEFKEVPSAVANDQFRDDDLERDEDRHLPETSTNFDDDIMIRSEESTEEHAGSTVSPNQITSNTYKMQPLVKVEDETCMSLDEIKELRLVMDIKAAAFREESRTQKGKVSDTQLQAIIIQHRKQKEECDRLRNLEKLRMKDKLKEKLAKRRSRKSTPITTVSEDTKENTKSAGNDDDHAQSQKKELRRAPSSSHPYKEDYDQIKDNHAREVTEIQQKIDLQKRRQRQELLDKLANRRTRRGNREVLRSLSVEEVDELQSAIDHNYNDIQGEIKANAENQSLEEEEQELMNEIQVMQQQLDEEKKLLISNLLAKLERRAESEEESNLTEDEIKQLELYLNEEDSAFKQNLESQKDSIPEDEYRDRFDRHNEEMKGLWDKVNGEKTRLAQHSNDNPMPHVERRPDPNDDDDDDDIEDVNNEIETIEGELEITIASLSREAEELRPLLSDEEYEQLLTQHMSQLQEIKSRLRVAMQREKRTGLDKDAGANATFGDIESSDEDRAIDLVKRMIAPNYDESEDLQPFTGEDYGVLEDDIKTYNTAILTNLTSKLQSGQISEAEYLHCMQEHQRNMQICDDKLEKYRHQLWDFMDMMSDSNDDDDSYDSEEANSSNILMDKDVQDAVPASTQLWTTPIQQPIVARVPQREEIPVRSKNQLFQDPSAFKHLDAHAIQLAQVGSLVTQTSFSALLNELTRIGTTELERVRLIFRWITAQNCQYMDIADAIDDTPLGVLKGLYHGKITFATLFTRMCRFQGLQCVEVPGCAKLKHYEPGEPISLDDPGFVHTWNAVRIDGYWYFIDCNWGVSYIPGSVSFDPFRFEYDEHYFLTDPKTMITTHFPRDPSWQLLSNTITLQQFIETVPVKPYFSKFGFELLSHSEPVIDTRDGELDVNIGCPDGFILYCKLTTVVDNKEISSHGIRLSQYVSIRYTVTNGANIIANCNIRFPEPGHYYVTLYAKEQFIDDGINLESQTEICKYKVKCYAPSSDQVPLPEAPANHWGPIGIEKAGLIPTHKHDVIEGCSGEDIEIKFRKLENVVIRHELTTDGSDGHDLVARSSHREFDDEIIFTLNLPEAGRYGFHIYTQHQGTHEEVHLCSYLIVLSDADLSESPLPPLPDGEMYGPSPALHDLGITSFTHPDPFIQTSDGDLQIVFGLSAMRVTLEHSFVYFSLTGGSNIDVSNSVKKKFEAGAEGSCVTFYFNFKKPGYYQFCLRGKGKSVPAKVPSTSLYNYLIRRD